MPGGRSIWKAQSELQGAPSPQRSCGEGHGFSTAGHWNTNWNWGWNALMERIYPRAALFYRDGKAYSGCVSVGIKENRQEEKATEKEPPTEQTRELYSLA
jgi:hypothetical protein